MLKLKRVKKSENTQTTVENKNSKKADHLFQKKLVRYLLKHQKQLNTIWLRCNSSQHQLILEVLANSSLNENEKMRKMKTIEIGYRLKLIWGLKEVKEKILIRETEPYQNIKKKTSPRTPSQHGESRTQTKEEEPKTPTQEEPIIIKTPEIIHKESKTPTITTTTTTTTEKEEEEQLKPVKKRHSVDITTRKTTNKEMKQKLIRKSYHGNRMPNQHTTTPTTTILQRIKDWKGSLRQRSSSTILTKAVTTPHTPKKDWELLKNALKSIVLSLEEFTDFLSEKDVGRYIDEELSSESLPNITKYKASHSKKLKKVKCKTLGSIFANEKIDGYVLKHMKHKNMTIQDLFRVLNITMPMEMKMLVDQLTLYTMEEWQVKKKYDASPLLKSKYAHKDKRQFINSLADSEKFMEEFLPLHRKTDSLRLMIPLHKNRINSNVSLDGIPQSPLVSPMKPNNSMTEDKVQNYVQNELFDFSESTLDDGDDLTNSEIQEKYDEDSDIDWDQEDDYYPDTEIQLDQSILNCSLQDPIDFHNSERCLPVKLVLSELRVSRMRRMVMNQFGPLVTNYSNMNTIGGLCFHSGLVIGPYYFEWNASELVIPRNPSSRLGFISLEIDRINLKDFKDNIREKIANFMVNWNATRQYANVGNNCQNFVEHLLSLLDIQCPYLNDKHGGAIGRYLHSLKKKGMSHFKLPLSQEFKDATRLSVDALKEDVFQPLRLPNDILEHTLLEFKKDQMYFSDHSTVDSFCNYILEVCPSVEMKFVEEWQLLKAFDRAFWMRQAALPGKQGDPLQDQCPFGNPSLQSFCLSPYSSSAFTP